jgi:hypothetical protein
LKIADCGLRIADCGLRIVKETSANIKKIFVKVAGGNVGVAKGDMRFAYRSAGHRRPVLRSL